MSKISQLHPRAESLRVREKLVKALKSNIVVPEGLTAHGRGEAFDYILGEKTTVQARRAIEAAVAMLLSAQRPVISVNGNAAALAPKFIVRLAGAVGAKIEVSLFHASRKREIAIASWLRKNGAKEILGVDKKFSARIDEIQSNRMKVDRRGIFAADVVLVQVEDGDRTEALKNRGKRVIAIDLNPMSRTAQAADVSIVDNIVRTLPLMAEHAEHRPRGRQKLNKIIRNFDNNINLKETYTHMREKLWKLSK